MGFLKSVKKIGKKAIRGIGKLFPGTGRHAAKRAEKEAQQFAQESQAERQKLEAKTKKERARAQKLSIRGMRSKRAASYFATSNQDSGSSTIG